MKKRILCCLMSLVMVMLLVPRAQGESGGTGTDRASYYTGLLKTVTADQLNYLHETIVKAENAQTDTWYPNLVRVVFDKSCSGLKSDNQDLSSYLRYAFPDVIGYYGIYYRFKAGGEGSASQDCVLDPDIAQRRQELNDRLPKMMEEVNALLPEKPTQFEMVHVAHDYLIANTFYDKVQISSNVDMTYDYDIYGVFCKHKSACAGYSLALKYILNQWHIDCLMVTSSNQNHGWNIVKLDGKWYHVDVSSDDPFYDMLGQVSHKYLCISTETLVSYNSGRADFKVVPDYDMFLDGETFTDDKFATQDYQGSEADLSSRSYWEDSVSVCHYYNGSIYNICPDSNLVGACALYQNGTRLYAPEGISMRWCIGMNSTQFYDHPMGRMTASGSDLYMTSPKGIYRLNLDDPTPQGTLCYTVPGSSEPGSQFFGLACIEGKLYCTASLLPPSGNETWVEFTPLSILLPSNSFVYSTAYSAYTTSWSIDSSMRITSEFLGYVNLYVAGYSSTGQMTGVSVLSDSQIPVTIPAGDTYNVFCIKSFAPACEYQTFQLK